jgi:hypothetical protein
VHLDQGTQGLRPSDGIFMPRSFVVADLGGGPDGCCCCQVTHFYFLTHHPVHRYPATDLVANLAAGQSVTGVRMPRSDYYHRQADVCVRMAKRGCLFVSDFVGDTGQRFCLPARV